MAEEKNPKETELKSRSISVPRRLEDESEYLPSPFDKMLPLYPEKSALDAAEAAFAILKAEYPEIVSSLTSCSEQNLKSGEAAATFSHPAHLALRDIAHRYFFNRRVYGRKAVGAELNAELARIKHAVTQLQDSLKSEEQHPQIDQAEEPVKNEEPDSISNQAQGLPEKVEQDSPTRDLTSKARPFVRGRLDIWLRRSFENDPSWAGFLRESHSDSPLRRIEIVLKKLAAACSKSIEEGAQRGVRPKTHITKATGDLDALWRSAGNEFKRNFTKAKGKGTPPADEFISRGPQLVWRVMSGIDSTLTIGEVEAALERSTAKRPKLSGNSSRSRPNFQTRKRVR